MTEVTTSELRPPAEVRYAAELASLARADQASGAPVPPGWQLSARAVRAFVVGDAGLGGALNLGDGLAEGFGVGGELFQIGGDRREIGLGADDREGALINSGAIAEVLVLSHEG